MVVKGWGMVRRRRARPAPHRGYRIESGKTKRVWVPDRGPARRKGCGYQIESGKSSKGGRGQKGTGEIDDKLWSGTRISSGSL